MSVALAEVAEALARYGRLRCEPTVETDGRDGCVLTVRIRPGLPSSSALVASTAGVLHELQYVCDVATMHALCARHGIEIEKLEALLPPRE